MARDIARIARIPGFRPGKAPVTLVRRRFADDIQGEVVQSLVPEYLGKGARRKKTGPSDAAGSRQEWNSRKASRCDSARSLKCFRNSSWAITRIFKFKWTRSKLATRKWIRRSKRCGSAPRTFVPVEGRAAKDGDSVQIN